MYNVFSSSQIGKRHEVNQDYTAFRQLPDGETICAVADGLGSCAKSDQGAKQAAEKYLDSFCASYTKERHVDEDAVLNLLSMAANKTNQFLLSLPIPEAYCTTLSVAFISGYKLYYFHSGDGSIIQVRTDGIVRNLTTEQKGSFASSVYPFQSENGSTWEYGVIDTDGDTLAIVLVTDGVLSALKEQHDIDPNLMIYTKLLRGLYGTDTTRFLNSFLSKLDKISDDKTLAVILNAALSKADVPESFELAEAPILFDSLYKSSVTTVLTDWNLGLQEMNKIQDTNLYFRDGVYVYPRFDVNRIYSGESRKENLVAMIGAILTICFENKEDIRKTIPESVAKYFPIYRRSSGDLSIAFYVFEDFILLSATDLPCDTPWCRNQERFLSHTHPIAERLLAIMEETGHMEEQ